MQRYFIEQFFEEIKPDSIELTGPEVHHIRQVMRGQIGTRFYLVFKDNISLVVEVISMAEKKVIVKKIKRETSNRELPVAVTIACGFPKGDKLEWIVQKTTELGVNRVIGFPAATSVVRWNQKKLTNRQERLEKIAQEAAEQSQRQKVPQIDLYENKNFLFEELAAYDYLLVAYEEAAKKGEASQLATVLTQLQPGNSVLVVFGPEGGLTKEEIKELEKNKAQICALGPRILRTETAPLYFLSSLSYQLELQKAD